jgi:hypothetical protein
MIGWLITAWLTKGRELPPRAGEVRRLRQLAELTRKPQ